IPNGHPRRTKVHKPFPQGWQPLDVLFHGLHGLLRPSDACLRGSRHQCHEGGLALPGQSPGTLAHGVNRVEPGPVPRVLHATPTAFEGRVLAVRGWGRGASSGAVILRHAIDDPRPAWGPSALV